MKESPYFLKQVIFKNQCTIQDCQEEISLAVKQLYPLNSTVKFLHGKNKWFGWVVAYGFGSTADYLRIKSKSGKIHSVYVNKILEVLG